MKYSAALKVKTNDLLVLNKNKDGVLWKVVNVSLPLFTIQECDQPTGKLSKVDYVCLHKPTKAQLNAYTKKQEVL